MQIYSPLKHHIEKYRTAAQTLRLWVLEVLAWWTGLFGDRGSRLYMQRCLRDARMDTRRLLFLAMMARLSYRTYKPPPRRTPSVRRGFRYAYKRFNPVRLCTRGIALKTLGDIHRVLENFDRVVERALARLPQCGVSGKPMIRSVGDPAHVRFSTSHADEVVRAPDTS